VGEFDPKVRFTQSPVARLATITPDGIPHLVPVVFAVDPDTRDGEEIVYTAIDAKPKTTLRLRRLANIENNPQASLLVDHYADDWTQLWWVRADGVAAIHRDDEQMHTGYRLLRAKYTQYQSVPLHGPVIAITVRRWSSWHAALKAPAPQL
jgi:PPOX class probable F420-dependent enzyme